MTTFRIKEISREQSLWLFWASAGRVNRSEDITRIWAQRTDSDDCDDFNGDAIFKVEVSKDIEDPEDFCDSDFHPQHPINGIEGSGFSGKITLSGNIGGVGVIGNGGANQGTGVLGRGAGGANKGVGGVGVHGIGGSQSEPTWDPNVPPGAGVLGQGGRQTKFNDQRLPHGAGAVAIAGGSGKPIPPLSETGGVGVYAQGAEAEVSAVNIDNVPTVVGPKEPGPGVLARGGMPIPQRGPIAAGVIGLAGDTPIPPISEAGNNGVYGAGPTGVFGQGVTGVFGQGIDDNGRGGRFASRRSAQVQIVPHQHPIPPHDSVAVTPTAVPASLAESVLPKEGNAGDLLATSDNQGQCTLWFCVHSGDTGPARWAQVLLGPSVNGQA